MQQLDPKAKWLFFVNSLAGFALFVFIILIVVVPTVLGIISDLSESANVDLPVTSVFLIPLLTSIVLVVLLAYVWAEWSWKLYKYSLSPDGFKKESGVIYKKYVTIPYDRIQNVDIYRGIITRLLGLSDLHIQTAGMSYTGKYGAISEGRLPGLAVTEAERLRDELIKRATHSRTKMSGGL